MKTSGYSLLNRAGYEMESMTWHEMAVRNCTLNAILAPECSGYRDSTVHGLHIGSASHSQHILQRVSEVEDLMPEGRRAAVSAAAEPPWSDSWHQINCHIVPLM